MRYPKNRIKLRKECEDWIRFHLPKGGKEVKSFMIENAASCIAMFVHQNYRRRIKGEVTK